MRNDAGAGRSVPSSRVAGVYASSSAPSCRASASTLLVTGDTETLA
jgi:hypothetical protein